MTRKEEVSHDEVKRKQLILIGSAILVVIVLFIFIDLMTKSRIAGLPVSPRVVSNTQPVMSFAGVVEKIDGNRMTVSKRQETETIVFQAVVSDKTPIGQLPPTVPYLIKKSPPSQVKRVVLKDIRVGQFVTLTSSTDLRLAKTNVFEPTSVTVRPKSIILDGTIVQISKNILILQAKPQIILPKIFGITPSPAIEKEYTILVSASTEISKKNSAALRQDNLDSNITPTSFVPIIVPFSDLKKDMRVIIFTQEDVTLQTKVTALLIVPVNSPISSMRGITPTP